VIAIAGASLVALGATAGAADTTRFSVIAVPINDHQLDANHFFERGRLVEPGERSEVLGAYRLVLNSRTGHTHLVLFFDDGRIKAIGDQHGRVPDLPIVGGSGRFNGADGKVSFHLLPHGRARLTITLDD
jgi:hypothetical protein